MNGYKAFFKDKIVELQASTSYAAQLGAAKLMNVKDSRRHLITVVLCEKDGKQVTHIATE